MEEIIDYNQGENPKSKVEYILSIGSVVLQIILALGTIYLFEIEKSMHLFELAGFVLIGFLLQILVPLEKRTIFFVVFTGFAAIYLLGWMQAVLVFFYGLLMIGAASLIRPKKWRYAAVLVLFGILAGLMYSQSDWVKSHFTAFAVLGSMFMFRLSLFLYERHYQPDLNRSFLKDIAYFFQLPNMALLLYPVVDYKTFLQSPKASERLQVYKKGVQWMVLGVFHLAFYRFLYYYVYLPQTEVRDLFSLSHYMVSNYLLIVRLSGIYHFSVGVLCLFGFNLPSVFNNYFLAKGFNDLWRRINIYYRDYVIKVFYYPIFFKLRKFGMVKGQIMSILMVFGITWFLHSFQWFWLKGQFPIRIVDVLYWGIFGVLVAANTVMEMKRSRSGSTENEWLASYLGSGQIISMFVLMSFLWSLWSSKGLRDWLDTISPLWNSAWIEYVYLLGLFLAVWAISGLIYYLFKRSDLGEFFNPDPKSKMATLWSYLMVGGLLAFQVPWVKHTIEDRFGVDLSGFVSPKLKESDEHLMIEGYYEEILIGNELTNPVAELRDRRTIKFKESEAAELVEDIRVVINKPNVQTTFKDKYYSTNSWGMRDMDYELLPSPQTIRMGFAGGSFVVGSGVADNDVFDQVLERNMNKSNADVKYEFLNFANSGYDILQCIYHFENQKHHRFELDYLVYVSHGVDIHKNIKSVLQAYNLGYEIPYPFIQDAIRKSGIQPSMSEAQQFKLLEPYGKDMVENLYKYFVEMCRRHQIVPVWLYWPTIASFIDQSVYLSNLAKKSGFIIIDLEKVYDEYDPNSLIVSMSDRHPNELGHKIIADALENYFKENFPLQKQVKTVK